MQPIVVAELICAFSLFVILCGMTMQHRPTATSNRMKILVLLSIAWAVTDAGSYVMNGPKYPKVLLLSISFVSYTLGILAIPVLIYYLKALLEEKHTMNPWLFRVPVIVALICFAGMAFYFFTGKLVVIEQGYLCGVGEIPYWISILVIGVLIYISVLSFLKRSILGLRTFFILFIYCAFPVAAVLLNMITRGVDYSVLAGVMAGFIVTELLQSNLVWQKEMAFEKSLSDTIEEQRKSLNIVTSLSEAYVCVYFLDLATERFQEITPTSVDAISHHIGAEGNAREKFIEMSRHLVAPEYALETLRFTNLDTLADRLQNRKTIEFEFLGKHIGWAIGEFVAVNRDVNGRCTHAMWAIRSIQEKKELLKHEQDLLLDLKMLLVALNTVFPRVNEMNLTQNTFKILAMDSFWQKRMEGYTTCEDLIQSAAELVPNDGQRDEYLAHFSVANQIAAYRRGERTILLVHQQLGGDRRLHWMQTQVVFLEGTGEDIIQVSFAKCVDEMMEEEAKLKEASRAKTSFLFNMSHDIRTPMNAIIGFTELMEKHIGDEEKCRDYLSKIQSSSNFLLSLINNVLEVAQIESGKATLDEVVCEIGSIVSEVNAVFEERMKKKNITYTSSSFFFSQYVYADTVKLKEIFLNLLSNAYKYTPEGGEVSVSYTEIPYERQGYMAVEIVVSDTGIGMSRDYLPHIFEEFSREKTYTEDKIEGTGLGMPIVKKMIDLMNGTIEVESELGKGTTFTITIPHRLAMVEEPHKSVEFKADETVFAGKRILLAEDNELNAEIAIEILQDVGFVVERAEDGIVCVDMLQKAGSGYYDLILMDIQMPNMDGYKATKVIREMEDTYCQQIPIIAMTANAFEEDKKNALDAGMNAHLAKPINVPEMMKTLEMIMK